MDMSAVAMVMGLLVSGLSLLTGIAGAVAWIQSKTRKEYAAERDFNHLKNSYKALTMNTEQLWRQQEEWHDTVLRRLDAMHGQMNTLHAQMNGRLLMDDKKPLP